MKFGPPEIVQIASTFTIVVFLYASAQAMGNKPSASDESQTAVSDIRPPKPPNPSGSHDMGVPGTSPFPDQGSRSENPAVNPIRPPETSTSTVKPR